MPAQPALGVRAQARVVRRLGQLVRFVEHGALLRALAAVVEAKGPAEQDLAALLAGQQAVHGKRAERQLGALFVP